MTQNTVSLDDMVLGMADEQEMEQAFAVVLPANVGAAWTALHRAMHAKVAHQRGTAVEQTPGDCGAGHCVLPREGGLEYLACTVQVLATGGSTADAAEVGEILHDLQQREDHVLLLGFMVWAPL